METRSAKRRSQRIVTVVSEKVPSSRRAVKAVKRTCCKSLLEDSGISAESPKRKTRTKSEIMPTLDDTPQHLYGLDREDPSSGDEAVVRKSGIQDNIRKKFHFAEKGFISGKEYLCGLDWKMGFISGMDYMKSHARQCLGVLCLVVVVLILVGWVGFAVQNNQRDLAGGKEEVQVSWDPALSYSLLELQEKLDVLSSKVNGLLVKDEKPNQVEPPKRNSPSMANEHLKAVIEKLVKEKMDAALETYSADKLGIPDFALESAGGQIHEPHHSTSFNKDAPVVSFFGIPLYYNVNSPRVLIQPDNTAGNCWAFEGQQGFVTIKLSQRIKVTAFTLEHIPAALSSTGDGKIPSAPREISVWGWEDAQGNDQKCIGHFTYDSSGKPLQTFSVQESESTFKYVQLRVHSNHGNPKYTCIYRFRVHGRLDEPCPEATPGDHGNNH